MNKPLFFSVALSILALPFTSYGAQLKYERFERNWLHDQSAEPRLEGVATYVIRSEDDLRKLPLDPSAIDYEPFRDFNFRKRALVFVIHPQLSSSANELVVEEVERQGSKLRVRAKYRRPLEECAVSADMALITDVISISQATARRLKGSRFTPQVRKVRYRCD